MLSKAKTFATIATLPEEYKPVENVFVNYITQSGIPMLLTINKDRSVQIYSPKEEKVDDFFIRQIIVYVAAN